MNVCAGAAGGGVAGSHTSLASYADDAGLAMSAMEQQLAIMAEWQRSEAQVGGEAGPRHMPSLILWLLACCSCIAGARVSTAAASKPILARILHDIVCGRRS
jgi:hypothetical protein